MEKANRPAAHIRHKGIMIDASFKGGTRKRKSNEVEYYVVQGSSGQFYSLDVAKEIAEHIARKRENELANTPNEVAAMRAGGGL